MTTAVYQAICAVQADLAQRGISKDRRNQQQGYSFRGIDDVFNAMAPVLARHKLTVIPRMLSRTCVERTNAKGTALFYVTVDAEFDFVSAEDGSKHTAKTYGEAMDSGDKATNKAMSAAYKYAAFLTFAIPTEGTPDADADPQHDVRPEPNAELVQRIDACNSMDDLASLWKSITPAERKLAAQHKERRKEELAADMPA